MGNTLSMNGYVSSVIYPRTLDPEIKKYFNATIEIASYNSKDIDNIIELREEIEGEIKNKEPRVEREAEDHFASEMNNHASTYAALAIAGSISTSALIALAIPMLATRFFLDSEVDAIRNNVAPIDESTPRKISEYIVHMENTLKELILEEEALTKEVSILRTQYEALTKQSI